MLGILKKKESSQEYPSSVDESSHCNESSLYPPSVVNLDENVSLPNADRSWTGQLEKYRDESSLQAPEEEFEVGQLDRYCEEAHRMKALGDEYMAKKVGGVTCY